MILWPAREGQKTKQLYAGHNLWLTYVTPIHLEEMEI